VKLDRNTTDEGDGKYAILNLRRLRGLRTGNGSLPPEIERALTDLEAAGVLEWSVKGEADEAFVMKLKDKWTAPALLAYADAAQDEDPEYAEEIRQLATRAGRNSPFCKRPD
jgi:hypothetical protein